MALYTTIHRHDVPDDKVDAYSPWFDRPHRAAVSQPRGCRSAERYEVTAEHVGLVTFQARVPR